jgi:hypothetical protein
MILGIQGRRIYKHKGIEIWSRPIAPIYQTYYSYAVAFVNRRTDGTPSDVAVTLRELGLQSPTGYRVEVRLKLSGSINELDDFNFSSSLGLVRGRWLRHFVTKHQD